MRGQPTNTDPLKKELTYIHCLFKHDEQLTVQNDCTCRLIEALRYRIYGFDGRGSAFILNNVCAQHGQVTECSQIFQRVQIPYSW